MKLSKQAKSTVFLCVFTLVLNAVHLLVGVNLTTTAIWMVTVSSLMSVGALIALGVQHGFGRKYEHKA